MLIIMRRSLLHELSRIEAKIIVNVAGKVDFIFCWMSFGCTPVAAYGRVLRWRGIFNVPPGQEARDLIYDQDK